MTDRRTLLTAAVVMTATLALPALAHAQVEPCPEPANLPPTDSPLLIRCMSIVAHPVNELIVPGETYEYHIKTPQTSSANKIFVPYSESSLIADFNSLFRTGFLDNLWIEVIDEPYPNGVKAKHIVFHLEERSRVKAVDYVPKNPKDKLKVEVSKIESTLKERNIEVRLDSFVDESTMRRVKGVIRELYSGEGYNDASVETTMTEVAGGPKLVNLEFTIDSGPKVQIREVAFDGNKAFADGKLEGQMKENKPKGALGMITGGGTFKEDKFADDASLVEDYYKDHGYVRVQVGAPQIEKIEDSKDGKTRWVRLRIPVDEGEKYKVGKIEITGDETIKHELIRPLFKLREGDEYSLKKMRKGIEKSKEIYGTFGFWQWQPEPELTFPGLNPETGRPDGPDPVPPVVNISIKMVEGKQAFVNRITFTGNTNTHDSVIRREMRVAEGGVFNTEALKESVRRLNQLGYFKAFEGKEEEMQVTPTPGTDNQVDIKLKFEEQNRNQISFGAGVSQFDGFFGQLSYQTSNFLGRGETMGVSLQKGSQAKQYQVSFSEPYLFDRPITAGVDVFSREYIFPLQYTQDSTGMNTVLGIPLADYTRLFLGYSYEEVRVFNINPAYLTPAALDSSPFLRDSLLIDQFGKRRVSKVSPSVIFNTVNQPIFPSRGTRYTTSLDVAGLGGNTQYVQSRAEGIWFHPVTARTSFGIRAEANYIRPYGATTTLPIFEKLFLGGEYSVRGFDIRSIGPRDPATGVVTGGNKTLTFNAEYYLNLFGQVRLVGFFDAGQVRDVGESFRWKDPVTRQDGPPLPPLIDPFSNGGLIIPDSIKTTVVGQTNAFKTSTGFEVRFFMPVLNVPFRLIGAYNPSRAGVLNNNLQPTPKYTFRFAVGTTF